MTPLETLQQEVPFFENIEEVVMWVQKQQLETAPNDLEKMSAIAIVGTHCMFCCLAAKLPMPLARQSAMGVLSRGMNLNGPILITSAEKFLDPEFDGAESMAKFRRLSDPWLKDVAAANLVRPGGVLDHKLINHLKTILAKGV